MFREKIFIIKTRFYDPRADRSPDDLYGAVNVVEFSRVTCRGRGNSQNDLPSFNKWTQDERTSGQFRAYPKWISRGTKSDNACEPTTSIVVCPIKVSLKGTRGEEAVYFYFCLASAK